MIDHSTPRLKFGKSEKSAGFTVLVMALAAPAFCHAQPSGFSDLAAQCAPWIHPTTLSAVVMHESRANPYAIGINGGRLKLPRQPRDRAEAIATAQQLRANGVNFDGGLGQINVTNLPWLGMTIADLFDPCLNLRGAGLVLSDCYTRASRARGGGQSALKAALSCYNTGSFTRGLTNGYVGKVTLRAGQPVPALSAPAAAPAKPSDLAPPAPPADAPPSSKDVFADPGPGRGDNTFGPPRRPAAIY